MIAENNNYNNFNKKWRNMFADFLHSQDLSKNTIKNYTADLKKFLNSASVTAKLFHPASTSGEIFSSEVFWQYRQTLLDALKNKQLKQKIANRRLVSVRRFGVFLKDSGRSGQNPAINLPEIKQSEILVGACQSKLIMAEEQRKYQPRGGTRLLGLTKLGGQAARPPLGLGIPIKSGQAHQVLNRFKQYLISQKISKISINNYLADSRQFLSWLESNNS